MKHLTLGPDLKLPAADAVVQKQAFLGRTGSGKTYAAMKHAEQLLRSGAQIVAVDWVGIWWGLRLDARGRKPSFAAARFVGRPLYIFGGEHGDVPLDVNAGDRFARLIVEKGVSAVLDVSLMRKHQRQTFVTQFAEEFFHAKKGRRSPVHVYLEEAQAFLPQMAPRGSERMLGAFEDIGKVGRNYGIGLSLISQRPQAVHKDVLNQSEVLYLFQLSGPQERKAVEAWAVDVAGERDSALDMLPHLKKGECIVWSPQWLRRKDQVSIGQRETFDVTPNATLTELIEPKPLTEADLKDLTASIEDVVERAEQTDVKALQRKVLELQRQLQDASEPAAAAIAKLKAKNADLTRLLRERRAQQLERFHKAVGELSTTGKAAMELAATILSGLQAQAEALAAPAPGSIDQQRTAVDGNGTRYRIENGIARPLPSATAPTPAVPKALPAGNAPGSPTVNSGRSGGTLAAAKTGDNAADRILAAAAMFAGPVPARRVAIMAGVSRSKSTWRIAMARLRKDGLIGDAPGDLIFATIDGADVAKGLPKLPEGEALVDYWRAQLGEGAARQIFEAVVSRRSVERDELLDVAGVDPGKSTFRIAMAKLTGLGLVERRGSAIVAADYLPQ